MSPSTGDHDRRACQHGFVALYTHIAFDEASKREPQVSIEGWINEWDVLN